jgi:minor extracellular serine protease Vpr
MERTGIAILALCLLAVSANAMDKARRELGADKAAAEFHATGEGVLVAIMDRGIDWLNDDFRNEDGTTRIQYIFDLTDDSGSNAPDNPFKVGTIYTRAQIDRALKGGPKLATRDAVGHGTTTTAIACGSGRNSPDRKYRGIAPKASIICVKLMSDGAPAHGDQPEEPAFFKAERIPVAIDFIRDRAGELKMPCVMVLNIGSQGGPTDGTSELCRKIDDSVGPGKPGLIFVTGTGDDGGRPNRAVGKVRQGEALPLKIKKESKTSIFVDLWYAGDDRFEVSVQTPTGEHGPFRSPTGENERSSESDKEFVYYHNTGNTRFHRPTNTKREVFVELKGPPGDYALVLHGTKVTNGRFDATINPNSPSPVQAPFNRFLNHLAPGNIWDGATARHNICPGDYVIRTESIDLNGKRWSKTGEGSVGELWKGSSTGPTFDGRHGVDFCVPADSVYTTYNPKSWWAEAKHNLASDGKGRYGNASAVSAANPMAAGVIALMLQIDPQLDAPTAKKFLQEASWADKFTGKTPNPNWGHGKLDAYVALKLTTQNRDKRK